MFQVNTWNPITVELETDPPQRFEFQIKMLSIGERGPFAEAYRRVLDPPWRTWLSRRSDRPDELERQADSTAFVMSATEVLERRLTELDPAQVETLRKEQRDAENERAAAIGVYVGQFVKMAPGQVTHDGTDVETGEQIVEAFGKYPALLLSLFTAIRTTNWMTEPEKKGSSSRSDSSGGSAAPPRAPRGATPATTAANAGSSDSATPATAPASSKASSSGDPVH